jgi:hypothetical protein
MPFYQHDYITQMHLDESKELKDDKVFLQEEFTERMNFSFINYTYRLRFDDS